MKQVSPKVDEDFERLFIDHPLYEMNKQTFCLEIEKVVKTRNMNYLEAVTFLCEQYEIDYSAIPNLISETMKDKIEVAATQRNLFRKHKPPAEAPQDFFVDDKESAND